MSVDLSLLSNNMVTAQALNNLILVWPQKQTGYQPQTQLFGGKTSSNERFLFDYEGDQTITLRSQITSSWVEENYQVNDHIALESDIITTNGFIGEVNTVVPTALIELDQAADKLQNISSMEPSLSISAQKAYDTAFKIYQAVELAKRTSIPAWNSSSGVTSNGPTEINQGVGAQELVDSIDLRTQSKQQIAFQKFYAYRKARTLFTVQTPWAIFKDCAIEELTSTQSATSAYVTQFAITFKPIMVAYTQLTSDAVGFQGRSYFHAAPASNSGEQSVDYRQGSFEDISGGR